jgi:hypothetical protein
MNENVSNIISKIRELLGTRRRLDEISRRLEQNTKAVGAADERNQQQCKIQNERLGEILAEYKQSERNRAANDDRHYSLQNSIRWATWLAFIAAVIYAGITWLNLNQIKKQTGFLRDAAIAANTQAGIAQQTLNASVENFKSDERAWLGFKPTIIITSPPAQNVKWGGRLQIQNYGKTPAQKVESIIRTKIICGPFPIHPSYRPKDTVSIDSRITVMPGEVVPTGLTTLDSELTSDDFKSFENKKCGLYYYAAIEYCDIFSRRHYRHFCMEWDSTPAPGFLSCGSYNDGDEDHSDKPPSCTP